MSVRNNNCPRYVPTGVSPVLCRYLPVNMLARLGQHMGVVTYAALNSAPESLMSLLAATRGWVPPSKES